MCNATCYDLLWVPFWCCAAAIVLMFARWIMMMIQAWIRYLKGEGQ